VLPGSAGCVTLSQEIVQTPRTLCTSRRSYDVHVMAFRQRVMQPKHALYQRLLKSVALLLHFIEPYLSDYSVTYTLLIT
jgi:hypothetical protein